MIFSTRDHAEFNNKFLFVYVTYIYTMYTFMPVHLFILRSFILYTLQQNV